MMVAAPKRWSLPASLALTAIGIPLVFYFRFGFVGGYAYGFTAFLILLQVAIDVIPKKAATLGASSEASKVAPSRFDVLGVVWLLSIPFAPFFGWIVTNAFSLTSDNWRLLYGVRAFVCVIVPLVSVLPLIRYVRGRPAAFMISVLAIGTAFPVFTGSAAAIDFVRGPAWETVRIVALRGIDFRSGSGHVAIPDAFVDVADGRTLTHADGLRGIALGTKELLVLHASDVILETR